MLDSIMITGILVTLGCAIVFLSQYSRFRLSAVEAITGQKKTLLEQFSLREHTTSFEKLVTENQQIISESEEITLLVEKAKLFNWLQGSAAALLVIEFIAYALLS